MNNPYLQDHGEAVLWNDHPVGETWITQHAMAGTWRVEALLDDGLSIASGTFTLTD